MPTDRQRQILDFVARYIERHGVGPKLREIGEGVGIRSRGTIHRHLRALEAAGLLAIEPDRARGIRLADTLDGDEGASLPVLGRISAGRPIEAVVDEQRFDLAEFFLGPDRYVLRVTGDSMIEDGIHDGDMVIIRHTRVARNGEVVVALIDGEDATLKRYQRNGDGSVTLVPANASMAPMRYSGDRVAIQGVLVALMRRY